MKKIIKDMWYERLSPGEIKAENVIKNQAMEQVDKAHIKLRAELNEKQRVLLKEYDATVADALDISDEELFVCGFRLGVRIIFEALSDD